MAAAYENNLSCAICLQLFDDPRILPCGHSYCLKCLVDLSKKMFNKCAMTCPICQAESTFENNVDAFYTKNYELSSLVQSIILDKRTRDRRGVTLLCEICDPGTSADRACVECETAYCENCFNTYHPLKGKFRTHKIVSADANFRSKIDMKKDDRNMYCCDCDALMSAADISKHQNHGVMSLKEAHSLFKVIVPETKSYAFCERGRRLVVMTRDHDIRGILVRFSSVPIICKQYMYVSCDGNHGTPTADIMQ